MDNTWELFKMPLPLFINFIHLFALDNMPNDILHLIFHLMIKLTWKIIKLPNYITLHQFIFKLNRIITYDFLCLNINNENKKLLLQKKLFKFIMESLSFNRLCCIYYKTYTERVNLQQFIGNNFPDVYKYNMNCPYLISKLNFKSYCPYCNKLNKINRDIDYDCCGDPFGVIATSTCTRCGNIDSIDDDLSYTNFKDDYILSSTKHNLLVLSSFQIKENKTSYKNAIETNDFNNILTDFAINIININDKKDAGIKKFPNISDKFNINNMKKFKEFVSKKIPSPCFIQVIT